MKQITLRNPRIEEVRRNVKSSHDARRKVDEHVVVYEKAEGGTYAFCIETRLGEQPALPTECVKTDVRVRQF